MRRLIALMLAAVLLTGCTAVQPVPSTAGEVKVQTYRNLQYIPNETVESMEVRQMLGTGDGLLLWGSDGALVLLSQEDLSVVAETTVDASDLAYVQVLDGGVSIADPEKKTVTMLTHDLTEAGSVTSGAGENTWLVRSDGGAVFTLASDGIEVWDLSEETSRELLRCRFLTAAAVSGKRVFLAAVGETDLMTHWYELDLEQGVLTELAGARMNALQEGMRPQNNGEYLRLDGNTAVLYDSAGGFLSTCTLPGEERSIGRDFIWSEQRQCWFFLAYGEDGCQLLCWDPSVWSEGSSIDIQPETVPAGEILPQELYDRAQELSERFDLDIRIADRAIRDYDGYNSEMLTDPEVTAQALDVLESTLSKYPEGFFTQLKHGDRHTIRIELVDALAGKNGHDVSSGTSAFTVRRDRYCMLVLNGRRIRESVIFHEFSHVIDKRLAWDAQLREDAMFSEEGWMALQPEGFEYAGSYTDIPKSVQKFYDSGYFVRDYSCVSASEDRAMTLEKAMVGENDVFTANPYLIPKLEYYCACIRDSFDTTGWPEVTVWEQLLR